MLLTMFLLGLLYVGFVAVLLAAGAGVVTMVVVIGALRRPAVPVGQDRPRRDGRKGGLAGGAPVFHAMIERLCIQADLLGGRRSPWPTWTCPTPSRWVARRRRNGLLHHGDHADPFAVELEGVMAHELSHVKHRDVLIMTIASFFASVAAMMMQFGLFFGGGGSDEEGTRLPGVLLVSFVVYIVSFFLMLALSRYREFTADRGAALINGSASALSSALVKISGAMQQVPTRDLREAERMNAFFIVPTSVRRASRRCSPRTRRWRSGSSGSSSSRRSSRARRSPPRLSRMGFLDAPWAAAASSRGRRRIGSSR